MITRKMLESSGFNLGYLLKSKSVNVQPSFATANLAIRRKVLDQVGSFDETSVTGEDFDLNLRVLNGNWECYYEHRAVISHKFRQTVFELAKQWYDYSFYHPYVIKKYMKPGIEFLVPISKHYTEVMRLPFPLRIVLRFSSFYLFHFFLLCLVLSQSESQKLFFLGMTLLSGIKYFVVPFSISQPFKFIGFMALRYVVNWARFLGGFFGGLRFGMIFFEDTWGQNPDPKKTASLL